jgi:hypothetical protein
VGRTARLVLLVVVLCGCSRSVPSLLDGNGHVVVSGKSYRFRVPVAGCGAPVVMVNGADWEPVSLPRGEFPSSWHAYDSGPRSHTTTYVTGTMRLVRGALELQLTDGTVVHYRVTSKAYPTNACA